MSANLLTFPSATMPSTDLIESKDTAPILDLDKLGVARKRMRVVQHALTLIDNMGWSINRVAGHIYDAAGITTHPLHAPCMELGKSNKRVSAAQISRWVKAFRKEGITGLVDQRAGRQKQDEGWELRAQQLFARPQKPSFNWVAKELGKEGFDVTYHRVRRYLNGLPTNLTTYSNKRQGAHHNRINNHKYKVRSFDNLPVGLVFQGDGHCCDVYVAHPMGKKVYRPELSAWIDVKSRFIVGWWLGDAENSRDTLFALSHAMVGYNHTPAIVHVDHGSGYISKLMSDENTGFYSRFNIDPMYSIPGNPGGKGQIERWFRTMEEQFGKSWETYCGKDMAGDEKRRIVQEVNRGKYQLPSLDSYTEALAAYIHEYNNTPHSALDGKTPAQMWEGLEQVTLEIPFEAVVLPVTERIVRRTGINLDKRLYRNDELLGWEGKAVHVQYSLHTDRVVRTLTTEGAWICDCKLIDKTPYLPDSRIEEASINRLQGQRKRKQIHADEDERRARMLLGGGSTSLLDQSGTLELPTLANDDDDLILDVAYDNTATDDDIELPIL